jgi:hypothetical protein
LITNTSGTCWRLNRPMQPHDGISAASHSPGGGSVNPITLEVFSNLYASVAEEMGTALCRAALSPNIKERRDFSCLVCDSSGELISQAAHIPVHLGSAPLSVQAALAFVTMAPGDVVLLNDPFRGGLICPISRWSLPYIWRIFTPLPLFSRQIGRIMQTWAEWRPVHGRRRHQAGCSGFGAGDGDDHFRKTRLISVRTQGRFSRKDGPQHACP